MPKSAVIVLKDHFCAFTICDRHFRCCDICGVVYGKAAGTFDVKQRFPCIGARQGQFARSVKLDAIIFRRNNIIKMDGNFYCFALG